MSEPAASDPGLTRRELREQREREKRDAARSFASTFAPPAEAGQGRPTILTVCTGNICRSPMAEVLLRARLPQTVKVHSAGTQAMVGHGMTPDAHDLAVEFGAAPDAADAHRARYLVEPTLAESDLVLTMTREHRSHVVQMMPSVIRRTFTLREFARLAARLSDEEASGVADAAGTDASARLSALARAVGGLRGGAPAADEDDDVVDPYGRGREAYELSASQLIPALAQVERLAGIAVHANAQ
ncbi:low molecular weight phosphatase family protein [Microbacterium sp. NPDC057650]|uniref:arsenate reductase/protein-tyrosine-phosphatase family protein n=1 Tax=unclassified Microbacterium TaxID=2609290 RepID=UPI00366CCC3C